jgi:uncharacterized membrane protein
MPGNSDSSTAARAVGFAATHPADRDAVAIAIAACWFGLLSGFVPEIVKGAAEGKTYVPSTYIHSASSVGWMVLLSWQALLVRRGEVPRHRKTGKRIGPWLAPLVVISALVTIWTSDRVLIAQGSFNPARLSFQVGHAIAFGALAGIALWRTDRPDMHKRLMLLAVFAMLDTGWSRWLGPSIVDLMGSGPVPQMLARFPLTWALMIAMAWFDMATRGRLHPAFLPASAFILATEFGALALYFAPWWPQVALRLLGV